MASILTFLGKGGTGRTTVAIAAAKQLARSGRRVLLLGSDPSPTWGRLLGREVGPDPELVEENFSAVQLQATVLLERSWEQVKQLEAQYLRSPTLKQVFGQELGVFPGMDGALALNALREFDASGRYDTLVYDGSGDLATLRTLGLPETMSWYIRRFRRVFIESELGQAIAPFIGPLSSAVLNGSWLTENFGERPLGQVNDLLERGKAAVTDPQRTRAYLVVGSDRASGETAKYLWGSAQQIGLSVGGVFLNGGEVTEAIASEFAPLPAVSLPRVDEGDWQTLLAALPDFQQVPDVPLPVRVDLDAKQVYLFMPSFNKKQVKLTQYGPEITIEAGDQRRNLSLPDPLNGRPVTGAKFQNSYLILSF